MTKKLLCLIIFQKPYIIWSSFMVLMCKSIIHPDIIYFHFFKVLIFWIIREEGGGVKGQKWPKMTKNSVCPTPYLRTHASYDCYFWYTWVKWLWWYLHSFFSFFQIINFVGFDKYIFTINWLKNFQCLSFANITHHALTEKFVQKLCKMCKNYVKH